MRSERCRRCESCYSYHSRESLFHIATVTRCRAEQRTNAHSNFPLTSTSISQQLSPQTRTPAASLDSEGDEGSDTKLRRQSTTRFQIKELGKETWPDFERMVEKHNGVWGGCWYTFFHLALARRSSGLGSTGSTRRSLSERTGPTRP